MEKAKKEGLPARNRSGNRRSIFNVGMTFTRGLFLRRICLLPRIEHGVKEARDSWAKKMIGIAGSFYTPGKGRKSRK